MYGLGTALALGLGYIPRAFSFRKQLSYRVLFAE